MIEFSVIVAYLVQWGYLGIFAGVILGGEILLLAAGFFASIGIFKLYYVIPLAVFGTILGDTIWYIMGRTGRKIKYLNGTLEKKVGVEKIKKFEDKLKRHTVKTILLIRLVYGFRAIVLIMAGITKINFFKYLLLNIIGTFIWASIFTFLGYFFGQSIIFVQSLVQNIIIFITIVVALFIVIMAIIILIKRSVAKKV